MHHRAYLAVHAPKNRLPEAEWPSVYRVVLPQLDPGAVLEFPWFYAWHHNSAYRIYQEGHGRDVVVGSISPWIGDPRVRFRTVLPPGPDEFLGSGARYLLVHLDYPAEEAKVRRLLWPRRIEIPRPVRGQMVEMGRSMARTLRRRWGPPDFRDRAVLLWDLARLRDRLRDRETRCVPPDPADPAGKSRTYEVGSAERDDTGA
jgi:hypothetical protein